MKFNVICEERPGLSASFTSLDDLQTYIEGLERSYTGTAYMCGTTEEVAASYPSPFEDYADMIRSSFPAGAILYRADGLHRREFNLAMNIGDKHILGLYSTEPVDRLEAIRAFLGYVDLYDEAVGGYTFRLEVTEE